MRQLQSKIDAVASLAKADTYSGEVEVLLGYD